MFNVRSLLFTTTLLFAAHFAAFGDQPDGLLFQASFDHGLDADHATGDKRHHSDGQVKLADGVGGAGALIYSPDEKHASLSYSATGNIGPNRGTVSFWLEPAWNTSITRAPVLFAVGGVFEIFYEPYHPAIVVMIKKSDGNLLPFEIKRKLNRDAWIHLTYSWDSEKGADLFLDGQPVGHLDATWQAPSMGKQARMVFDLTKDLGGRPKVHPLGGTVDELKIFSTPLSTRRVARLFVEDGGQLGQVHRYELTVDFGARVNFGRLEWREQAKTRVNIRTSSAQPVTWSDLSWGGPQSWSRAVKLGKDGAIATEPGRHLKLIVTFKSPVKPTRLPLDNLSVTYSHLHDGAHQIQRVLDPLLARPPAAQASHIPLTMAIETPHEKWAQPYQKGKTRALILTHLHNQREIVELAQRMDLDFNTASVTKHNWLLSVASRHRGKLTWSNVMSRLANDLRSNKYDVIVIGGVPWKRIFTSEIRKLVLGQAKRGAGLVVILDPADTTDDLAALLPLQEFVPSGLTADPIWSHSAFIGEFRGKWRSAGSHFIVNGVPFGVLPDTPYFRFAQQDGPVIARAGDGDDALVAVGEYGQGRVVQITYGTAKGWGGNRSLTPHVPYDTPFHYWEYYLSLVGRSMLWAARHEPDISIKNLSPRGEVFEALAGRAVTIELDNHGPDRSLDVALTIRDERWQTVAEHNKPLQCAAGATATTTFKLPTQLTGGMYVADTVIREAGKAMNWGSAYFCVAPSVRIIRHDFDRRIYTANESVIVALTLAARGGGGQDVQVNIKLLDTYDRLLAETREQVNVTGESELRMDLGRVQSMTPYVRAEFELWQADSLIARDEGYVLTRRQWRWDDYRPVMWSDFATTSVMEYLRPYYIDKIREMGFDAIEDDSHFAEDLQSYCKQNMQPFPIGFGGTTFHGDVQKKYEDTGDKKQLVRKPCLHDPKYILDAGNTAKALVDKLKDLNPLGYVLADETSLTSAGVTTYPTRGVDICFTCDTLNAFRQWLKGEYATLADLNEQWETDFGSWNQVTASTKEELLPEKTGNFSSWSDHRTFMEKSFLDAYMISVDILRQANPGVPVGLCGTSPPATYTGFDYSRLGQVFDTHWMYYTGSAGEMWRSFKPEGSFLSCQGYGQSELKRKAMIWDTLLNGHKGTLQWTLPIFINPDLTLSPDGEDLKNWHRELRSGVGRILIEAKMKTDPIAILYSQRGIQAAWITGAGKGDAAVTRFESLYSTQVKDTWISANEVRHLDNMDTYCNLLEGANFQYNFVTPGQVANGHLRSEHYKVLILPWVMPISKDESRAIRAFVKGGGLLIADVLPGIMDGHCRTLANGALDDIFGVRTSGYQSVNVSGEAICGGELCASLPLGNTLRDVLAGPSAAPAGAQPHATITAGSMNEAGLYIQQYGKGTAVLLNFLFSNKVDTATWTNQAQMLAHLLARAQIAPNVNIAGPDPFIPYYEPTFYQQGDSLEYLGVLRRLFSGDRHEQITIELNDARHVYDVRRRAYLGFTDSITTTIDPGEAGIFALLRYRVHGVKLELPDTCAPGGVLSYTARIETDDLPAGDHVVRLEVYDSDGVLLEPYTGNFLSTEGVVNRTIKLALNDPPGNWRLRAIDVVSGTVAEGTTAISH